MAFTTSPTCSTGPLRVCGCLQRTQAGIFGPTGRAKGRQLHSRVRDGRLATHEPLHYIRPSLCDGAEQSSQLPLRFHSCRSEEMGKRGFSGEILEGVSQLLHGR
jgi:hypothetical protein